MDFIKSISEPHILAQRLNKIGGIVRHGNRWFQTEYSLGYNVFEYRNISDLRYSRPFAMHSLEVNQFDGTDNTACSKDTFVYYEATSSHIHSYQLNEHHLINATIRASKNPIYHFSRSFIDLENDDGNLWILYRSAIDGTFHASLRDCTSLKERKSWNLQFMDAKNIVNAFIACGHLYTVSQNITSNILNIIYDFNTGKFFQDMPVIGSWKRNGVPSNIQYDHISKTINAFDDGIIYSITVHM
ncbi:unnamed protein product [Thelazia callipaeda]|uniref:Olfactomedin-like domain-containing protein n=1 Tax=Thelazia callipaeda TaxID=103827 RepID=A0A0N5D501_THECL|nr:unnamed protein product [Thelazia callipaeda]